jgi:hypothetical protein
MSYGWDNCLRTELCTTFLLQINCKSYDVKVLIIHLLSNNKFSFQVKGKILKYHLSGI